MIHGLEKARRCKVYIEDDAKGNAIHDLLLKYSGCCHSMYLFLDLYFIPDNTSCLTDNICQFPAASFCSCKNLGKLVYILYPAAPSHICQKEFHRPVHPDPCCNICKFFCYHPLWTVQHFQFLYTHEKAVFQGISGT